MTPQPTLYPIISLIITYDSKRIVTITKASDTAYFVKMYDLKTFELTFEELIGNQEADDKEKYYIKIKDIE